MTNKNHIKKLLAIAIMLLFTGVISAQTTSKEINNIKRNQMYIYSESTMASEAEARDVANELLMKQIEEYISSKRKLTNADNVLIKNISTKSESMTMMRGTMYRVFVYVKKSDIEGVDNTTVINTKSGTKTSISDSPLSSANLSDSPSTTVNIPESEIAVEMTPDEVVDIDIPVAANTAPPTSEAEKAVDKTPVPTPKEPDAQSANNAESPLSGWKQDAVNSLLKCEDLTAFQARLNRLKTEYKIKNYGTADRCPSVANSFWAIFDEKGKLVTILGNGQNERIDYRTMTMSSLDNHKGKNALWFSFSK